MHFGMIKGKRFFFVSAVYLEDLISYPEPSTVLKVADSDISNDWSTSFVTVTDTLRFENGD